ncbi:MAG TPA: cob(I)yrinic acid a,c-diamide adenosyltransferase [Caulobacteraceae bacterium]|jgi:cob(I)alamin adenosyltransferase|nr:cob(I)yrinic acid a,c-diamide adenosyltransferase [Caulobacteraceae bacterium]
MVTLNRIYTRAGDDGRTRLASGAPVLKYDLRVAAYGEVDETNACVGLVRLHTGADLVLDPMLARIQNDLFDLGADLATPERDDAAAPVTALRILDVQVERLEREIDRLNGELSPLTSFILPGGSPAAAALHLARTVCRRAERSAVELSRQDGERVGAPALKYLNRLSDLLFVAARWTNDKGAGDVLWAPGATR